MKKKSKRAFQLLNVTQLSLSVMVPGQNYAHAVSREKTLQNLPNILPQKGNIALMNDVGGLINDTESFHLSSILPLSD